MTHLSETRKLSLHPLAIHTFIKAQAGSLGKALSEAVMNSIDAFATSVDITLTESGFVLEDNGQGFRTRDEIEAWFETLGFPHDDGNHRVYGKFGMGRAQMWAFARTVWTSNQFVMRVDVKSKGLDYELDEVKEPFAGTRIEAKFYEPLSFQACALAEQELTNLVRYVPGLVTLNGKPVNKDPSIEKWDLETKEAWMRFDKSMHTLDVYNGGVLVTHFARYRFGCTGVIVTKPEATLSLNLARNDILESDCKVWPLIVKSLPKQESDYNRTKAKADKPSKRTVEDTARQVTAGVLRLQDAMEKVSGLVTSVYGRAIKYSDLVNRWNSRPVVVVPKGDDFGKRLSKLRRAEVLSNETLTRFGCATVAEFKALVRASVTSSKDREDWNKHVLQMLDTCIWTDEPKALFKDLADGKEVYAQSELSEQEKAVAAAWSRARYPLVRSLQEVASESQLAQLRDLGAVSLGDSAVDLCWVDSASREWVLRKKEAVAALEKSLSPMLQFALARVKDLCFEVSENEAQGDLLFARLCTQTDAVGALSLNLTRFYVNECRQRDIPVSKTRLSDLDQLNVE